MTSDFIAQDSRAIRNGHAPTPSAERWQIVAYMNAFTIGASGADIMCSEVLKRSPSKNIEVVTSAQGRSLLINLGHSDCRFRITSCRWPPISLICTYIQRTLAAILRAPKLSGPTIVYSSSDFFPDTLPSLWLKTRYRSRRIVWVQRVHHLIPRERRVAHFAQIISLWMIRRYADSVICADRGLINTLINRGFLPGRIHFNVAGVRQPAIGLAPITSPSAAYEAVYVGRLHPSKGIFDLPIIWREVLQAMPKARLAIIGAAPSKTVEAALREAFNKMGVNGSETVDFLGFQNDSAMWSILKNARVLLCPSHEEGFGIIPIEGLAAGLQVVAYDLPAYQTTVAEAMHIAPCFDTGAFAKLITQATTDENLAERKRQIAAKLLPTFSWDSVSKREWEIAMSSTNKT